MTAGTTPNPGTTIIPCHNDRNDPAHDFKALPTSGNLDATNSALLVCAYCGGGLTVTPGQPPQFRRAQVTD